MIKFKNIILVGLIIDVYGQGEQVMKNCCDIIQAPELTHLYITQFKYENMHCDITVYVSYFVTILIRS